jgi:hypothetical protein
MSISYILSIIFLFFILFSVIFIFIINLPELYLILFKKMPPYVSTEKRVYKIIKVYLEDKYPNRDLHIVELGSGNGRGLRHLTENNDWKGTGYELAWRPLLESWLGNKISGNQNTTFLYKDMFKADLSKADVLYTYLFNEINARLEGKISSELKSGTLVFSYAFTYPNLPLLETIKLDKLRHKDLHVYQIP